MKEQTLYDLFLSNLHWLFCIFVFLPLIIKQLRINRGVETVKEKKVFSWLIPCKGNLNVAETQISRYLSAIGYHKSFGSEAPHHKGNGILIPAKFFKISQKQNGIRFEFYRAQLGFTRNYLASLNKLLIIQISLKNIIESLDIGVAFVKLKGKWVFIDKLGKRVSHLRYDDAGTFKEGIARVKFKKQWGFVNRAGKEIIPCIYSGALDFSEELASVILNKKWGFIDKNGTEIIPIKYDQSGSFSEGLAVVCIDRKCGYIDKTGAVVIPLQYAGALDFFEGLAAVKGEWGLGWGFIDKTGALVITYAYDSVEESFKNGFAQVSIIRGSGDDEKYEHYKIDKNGTRYEL